MRPFTRDSETGKGAANAPVKISAPILVRSLFDELVVGTADGDFGDAVNNPGTRERYETKRATYRAACLLMAVLAEEQRNPKFALVREAFEREVLPAVPSVEANATVGQLKAAMGDLANLIDATERQQAVSWAHNWLLDAAADETNPVCLTLFASWWMNYYVSIVDSLRDFDPTE